jgi:phytol kinase
MIHSLNVNMWFGIVIELAVLTTLMGSLTLYQRWQPLSPEASRKLFHIGGGLTALTFLWVFNSVWPVILLALITTPSLLALKYVRIFKGNLGLVLYRVNRTSFGEIYFPLSVCLLFVFARGDALLFLVPILVLTLADPAAAIIGCRYGRTRYMTIRGWKSVEGSATFFLVAFPCVLFPLLLFTTMSLMTALLIALLVGLLAMLTEAVAWEGLDNFFIPVFSCLLLTGLLRLNILFLFLDLVMVLCLLAMTFWLAQQNFSKAAIKEKRL